MVNDENDAKDPIEIAGRRIARVLSLIAVAGLLVWLGVTYF
ncbi:hypothetical protein [Chthonobacter albigriseus]|nr:hypothetical protein [Chthonobacter albigriseus]